MPEPRPYVHVTRRSSRLSNVYVPLGHIPELAADPPAPESGASLYILVVDDVPEIRARFANGDIITLAVR